MLPDFFILPPPANDLQRAEATDFLDFYTHEEFDAPPPPLVLDPCVIDAVSGKKGTTLY